MKINVNRSNTPQGELIFTVTVSDPHHACFGTNEKSILDLVENCKKDICQFASENKVKDDALTLIQYAQEKTFKRVLDNLKCAIENEFRPKFKHICQEIYNWIYDHQTGPLKTWMYEFDPQRTKYYFDNDITPTKINQPQASEYEDEED